MTDEIKNGAWIMCGRTDPGVVRELNEDAFWCDAGLGAAIVADGLGGHAAGEVASAETVQVFSETFTRSLEADGAGVQNDLQVDRVKGLMVEALGTANSRVRDMIAVDQSKEGMGSTAVCACLCGGNLVLAHIGDSRAYLWRAGLTPLTKDHSYVQQLVDSGALDPAEAEKHPQRNLITRCIGGDPQAEIDLAVLAVEPDDLLLLCSDGLCGVLDEVDIAAILAEAASIEAACNALVQATLAAGAPDNVTVLLIGPSGWYGWKGRMSELSVSLLQPATWRAGRGQEQIKTLGWVVRCQGQRWWRYCRQWADQAWQMARRWRTRLPF
jgi:PPM family protein phosphatase